MSDFGVSDERSNTPAPVAGCRLPTTVAPQSTDASTSESNATFWSRFSVTPLMLCVCFIFSVAV